MIPRRRQPYHDKGSRAVISWIRHPVFACFSACVVLGTSAILLRIHIRPPLSETEATISLIEQMPDWMSISKLGGPDSVRMISTLEQIDKEDTALLRMAVQRYWEREVLAKIGSLEAQGRLFILNRFIFNVPQVIDGGTVRAYGGWDGIPINPDRTTVDLAWPLATGNGHVALVGMYQGYCGDLYLAPDEFDDFNSRFGRRRKIR